MFRLAHTYSLKVVLLAKAVSTMLGILNRLNSCPNTFVGSESVVQNTDTTLDKQQREREEAHHLSFLRSLSDQDCIALTAQHQLQEGFLCLARLLLETQTDSHCEPDPDSDTASAMAALSPVAVAQLTEAWAAHLRGLLKKSEPHVLCLEAACGVPVTSTSTGTSGISVVLYKPNWYYMCYKPGE